MVVCVFSSLASRMFVKAVLITNISAVQNRCFAYEYINVYTILKQLHNQYIIVYVPSRILVKMGQNSVCISTSVQLYFLVSNNGYI